MEHPTENPLPNTSVGATDVTTAHTTTLIVTNNNAAPSQTTPSTTTSSNNAELERQYVACMILSAVGDAIGYRGGSWEFSKRGQDIHDEAASMGGVESLKVDAKEFPVSDDTVMHIATAKALCKDWDWEIASNKELEVKQFKRLFDHLCQEYVECWDRMGGRAPGIQCAQMMPKLKKNQWETIPYSSSAGGCGASMRTMCIGLIFWRENQLHNLIRVSIEAGRMTHNHPTGFLGGLISALFTSYALQNIPMKNWGWLYVEKVIPQVHAILKNDKRDWEHYADSMAYFEDHWKKYLKQRGIDVENGNLVFPDTYGVKQRDEFYKKLSYSGWGGSSGHDSVLIAYDALLGCNGNWSEFLKRGALHGGDSDSTAAIGAAWFGVVFGMATVPSNHYAKLEFKDEIEGLGVDLLKRRKDMDEIVRKANL